MTYGNIRRDYQERMHQLQSPLSKVIIWSL